jgi:alkylation response protein AidB-like acyl-CoA dehydrogenase
MAMDFDVPVELRQLQDEANELGAKWTVSGSHHEDAWIVGHSRELARELGERGWIGMTWPVEAGGHGRTLLERLVVFEALIAQGAPIASMWLADRQVGPTLLQFGTPEQRRRFLPGIVAGTAMWCIGMSEPDAGSDVAALRTKATRDGSGWVIDGRKVWTSGAHDADWCYVIARTDPEVPKHAGLSEFVVDMSAPGITVQPIVDMTGDGHFCEVTFDDVRVPDQHQVGEVNGSFRQVMRQLEHERGGIDRLLSNRRLYLDLLETGAVDRSDPVVRQELAVLETGYRLGRLMVLRELLGQAPKGFSAVTKTFCTEFEQRVTAFCASVAGPHALLWEGEDGLGPRVARNVCYAPAYTIMGGTTQILRNLVAERLLGLPR